MAEKIAKKPSHSHGNIRLCVITWNVGNKEVSFLDVDALMDHTFRVRIDGFLFTSLCFWLFVFVDSTYVDRPVYLMTSCHRIVQIKT